MSGPNDFAARLRVIAGEAAAAAITVEFGGKRVYIPAPAEPDAPDLAEFIAWARLLNARQRGHILALMQELDGSAGS